MTAEARLAAEGGEAIAIGDFHAEIARGCLDVMAMLARDREVLPLRARVEAEARLVRQRDAIVALGEGGIEAVCATWERALEDEGAWKAWAAAFALGSFGGDTALQAIEDAVETLPEGDHERWTAVAEALALASHPGLADLARRLRASAIASARAIGLDLASRAGPIPIDALAPHLAADAAEPAIAAIRALDRAGSVTAAAPLIARWLHNADADAAWEAARALTRAGSRVPCEEVRAGGPLGASLGSRAIELFVMAGDADDLPRIEAILASSPMTPRLLSAVARFGEITTWSFLLHYLADPELAGAAVSALRTLFGDLVPAADATRFAAWKEAIVEAGLDPELRCRAGKPWRAQAVLAEHIAGDLPRAEVAARLDELAARAGARVSVDLGRWAHEVESALLELGVVVTAAGERARPGAWK